MPNDRMRLFYSVAILCAFISLCGCPRPYRSISAPKTPLIAPQTYYSASDYQRDLATYTVATSCLGGGSISTVGSGSTTSITGSGFVTFTIQSAGSSSCGDVAKQARNNIVYGLMSQIEVVYGDYYNHLFTTQSAMAISSDVLNFGMSSAASIATHAATKTIFSALGSGVSGVGLSVNKNLFAQQAFGVLGEAMQTRRDKVRVAIINNLDLDTIEYPLLAAKQDLVIYLNAGTLASGLAELQEEAGGSAVHSLATPTPVPSATPKSTPTPHLLMLPPELSTPTPTAAPDVTPTPKHTRMLTK